MERKYAMLAPKRSAGVAPKVNLREHVTYMPPPSVNKAAHSGFETQRRHHQKSKTGVSMASQKGLMSSKNFKKEKEKCLKRVSFYLIYKLLYLKTLWINKLQLKVVKVSQMAIRCKGMSMHEIV